MSVKFTTPCVLSLMCKGQFTLSVSVNAATTSINLGLQPILKRLTWCIRKSVYKQEESIPGTMRTHPLRWPPLDVGTSGSCGWVGPQVNKCERVSNDDHHMSLAEGGIPGPSDIADNVVDTPVMLRVMKLTFVFLSRSRELGQADRLDAHELQQQLQW